MDEGSLGALRQLLTTRLNELHRDLNIVRNSREERAGDSQDPMDEVDMTASRSAWENRVRMYHRNRLLAFEITAALDRIRKGEFGICTNCGDPISLKRLQAHPMSSMCIECKKRAEATRPPKAA
jgi:DnaK suppressor protein